MKNLLYIALAIVLLTGGLIAAEASASSASHRQISGQMILREQINSGGGDNQGGGDNGGGGSPGRHEGLDNVTEDDHMDMGRLIDDMNHRREDRRHITGLDNNNAQSALDMFVQGRDIFRFDTFGDEAFWGDTLKLHQGVANVSPRTALAVGLKVDVNALPESLKNDLKNNRMDLDDPANTRALLKLNAVVGVKGIFTGNNLTSIGITCALCHSTVDNSLAQGIGRRLDGRANRDLNVGAVINLSPDLTPVANLLNVSEPTVRTVLNSWGPGKFDAELFMDGKAFNGNRSAATLIPPAFGLAGVNLHTWTGWGSVPHWNAFVGNLEMHGKGTFFDPRLNDSTQFPIAAANGFGDVRNDPDLITSKLPALHFYQLSLLAPRPPRNTFDHDAAERGAVIFKGKANCARCHVPPIFTEPGWNMHSPSEIGIDDFQANRAPDKHYRTSPLAGLWTHQTGGFYHDGRFATLLDVVNHYDSFFGLNLTPQEKNDTVEYLKSLPNRKVEKHEAVRDTVEYFNGDRSKDEAVDALVSYFGSGSSSPQNQVEDNVDRMDDNDHLDFDNAMDDMNNRRGKIVQISKFDRENFHNVLDSFMAGRSTFRFDTFGDEAFWGDTLKLHQGVANVSPRTALAVGLKVDAEALPAPVIRGIENGSVNLDDPATTLALLKLNAVVGVKGTFTGNNLTSIGITCALCHSTVNNSFAPGIGHRLDGWANRDLNVGAIVNLSPDLTPVASLLNVSEPTVRTVLNSWGPGKFDAELFMDGKAFNGNSSAATLIPPAFGLAGVNLHTWTGWGSVTYWNAFVANLEMHGKGTFFDPRLNNSTQFPVAAANGFGNVRNDPDLITGKLPALQLYQLAIPAPKAPNGSFDAAAALRGAGIFKGKAGCARCHVPPLFTEPGWNMHTPSEIGIDDFQANRAPDRRYRTSPIGGLWTHQNSTYHDGRFANLTAVVNHYDSFFVLNLTSQEKNDVVEYLKSIP